MSGIRVSTQITKNRICIQYRDMNDFLINVMSPKEFAELNVEILCQINFKVLKLFHAGNSKLK